MCTLIPSFEAYFMFNLHVSLMAFQVQSSGSVDRETLLVIFVGIIALFFLALLAGLAGAVLYALKLKRDVLKAIDAVKVTVQEKAYPVVASTQELIRDLTPKIKTITENAAEISHTVRAQVTDIDSTLSNMTAKARAQADRVNGMVDSTLNTTSSVVGSVERGVKAPIREVAGVLAGIKAGWEVLLRPSTPAAKTRVRRAAQHVETLEEEIANDAARASHVNEQRSTSAQGTPFDLRGTTGSASRSVVGAGEEIVTAGSDISEKGSTTLESGMEDLQQRKTVSPLR